MSHLLAIVESKFGYMLETPNIQHYRKVKMCWCGQSAGKTCVLSSGKVICENSKHKTEIDLAGMKFPMGGRLVTSMERPKGEISLTLAKACKFKKPWIVQCC